MDQNIECDNYMYFNPLSWFYFRFHVDEFWCIGYILLWFYAAFLGLEKFSYLQILIQL